MARPCELYLVRHAIAAERGGDWPDDDKRPLTQRGVARFKEAVEGFNKLDDGIDEIFTSPLVRARQTAELLAAGLPGKASDQGSRCARARPPAVVGDGPARAQRPSTPHRARGPRAVPWRAGGSSDWCRAGVAVQEGRHLPHRCRKPHVATSGRTDMVRAAKAASRSRSEVAAQSRVNRTPWHRRV